MSARNFWGKERLVYLTSCLGALASACLDRPLCSSECQPETTNQFVHRVPTGGIDKIDFLFMIDNSASMSDKQNLLRRAVPSLVSRFLTPLCVDANGKPNGAAYQGGQCTSGAPQFPAVNDIHIAVITSSLGAAGGTGECVIRAGENNDDHAWLLPKARPESALPSWNGSGFLNWDPKGKSQPGGSSDPMQLTTDFQNQVAAAGEVGCGYEASLESWYRFLIDPDPAKSVAIQGAVSVKVDLDENLLAQRKHFLRADSLLAIVMLTDENDCSIRVGGSGHLIAGARMPRATAVCAQNPDDPCCRSCGTVEDKPPIGCSPLAEDSQCKLGPALSDGEDSKNLRCWDQKRRFGADFLEPTSKYVRALTQKTVPDRNGVEQPNPIFVGGREPDLVYLAGVIGVPWQDIATDGSRSGAELEYLTPAELTEKGRWEVILGDPVTRKPPSDPHMIESPNPRSGNHPFLAQAAIAGPEAPTPRSDVIGGHEHSPIASGDLQYSCIFELETPRICSSGNGCDCNSDSDLSAKKALCQPPGGGAFGNTQFFAKAYPGLRHLEVLRGLGKQAIVASICPKVARSANPEGDVNFGYNPAMDAIVKNFIPHLNNQCLGRAPEVDADGRTSCVVLEAQLSGQCDCDKSGRSTADAASLDAVRDDLRRSNLCDTDSSPACSKVCACGVAEARDAAALKACRTHNDPSSQAPGYCYVEPDKGLGDPALVRDCPNTKRRLLRFVGANTPTPGSIAYMACQGSVLRR